MEAPGTKGSDVFLLVPSPPAQAIPVRGVRSTLVTSGLLVLRERGLFDRYLAALPTRHHAVLTGLVAGAWLATDFMLAHYAAWDSLSLHEDDIRSIGASVASRVRENLLRAMKHIAAGAGVTPWTALAQYERLWSRAFDGGGVRIECTGPKDATIQLFEIPFARSPYFRGSIVAFHETGLGMFAASKMYVRVLPKSISPTAFTLRAAWV
jgi:hypothetical protein